MKSLVLPITISVLAGGFAYTAQAQTPCGNQRVKLTRSLDSRGPVPNTSNLYPPMSSECAPESRQQVQPGAVRVVTETAPTTTSYWHEARVANSSQNSTQEAPDQKLRRRSTAESSNGPDNTYCEKGNIPKFGSSDGPAELPRTCFYTAREATPSPGKIIQVNKRESVGDAIARANCGDTIELQAGGTYTGLTSIPAKPCDDQHWITVRTSEWRRLPPEGTRVTPCYGGVPSLRGRPGYSCSHAENVMAKVVEAPKGGEMHFVSGANHYRFVGIELTRQPGVGDSADSSRSSVVCQWPALRRLVGRGGMCEPTSIVYFLADLGRARKIIFDQVWMHGVDSATYGDETTVGVFLDLANSAAVVDSYFNDFYCVSGIGTCTDAKAIAGGIGDPGGNPWGTWKIVNNFLEGSGENILTGGGGGIGAPADIEIRRNHMFKPTIWNPNDPSYNGGAHGHGVMVKNLLEFKNAHRVLIEGNVFENSWGGFSQDGGAIVLTPVNQDGACPTCFVSDITIRYNLIRRAAQPFAMANVGAPNAGGHNYSIHDIVADHMQYRPGCYGTTCTPYLGQIYTGTDIKVASQVIHDVAINHITVVLDNQRGTSMMAVSGPPAATGSQMSNLTFKNSIFPAGEYGIGSAEGSKTDCANGPLASTPILQACFGTYVFQNNLIPWAANSGVTWNGSNLKLVANQNAVGFVSLSEEDYHLSANSPGKGKATDGKDIGADVNAVNTYTREVQ